MNDEDLQCVVKTNSIVGESPLWNPNDKRVYWVDIFGQIIHSYDPHTKEHKTIQLPEIVTSINLSKNTNFVLTLRKKFVYFDPQLIKSTPITTIEKDLPNNRFNDGKCDRFGRLWAGTINGVKWKEPTGNLYCLHPNGRVESMEKGGICYNGMGWSPDNRTMYVTQSFRYAIYAYDFDFTSGQLTNKRVFASVTENSGGFPDGLTIDAEGFVWSAQCGLGQIVRYDPMGKIERVIKLPVPRTTSCNFGGENLDTLYITSARETMTADQIKKFPLSGSLFALHTNIKGLPDPTFG